MARIAGPYGEISSTQLRMLAHIARDYDKPDAELLAHAQATQDELQAYRGTYAPSNGFRADWVNTFDLRLTQELPGFFKGHKSKLWVDVQNVGNLLNKDWGHVMDYGFFANARVATLQGIYNGKYVYNFNRADSPSVANGDSDGVNQGISQWAVQVGFKYEF